MKIKSKLQISMMLKFNILLFIFSLKISLLTKSFWKFSLFIYILFYSSNLLAITYYIDSEKGTFNGDALTPQSAKNEYWFLENRTIQPGDSILFSRGSTFNGYFTCSFSGNEQKYITIGAYGNGPNPQFSNVGEWYAIALSGDYLKLQDVTCTATYESGVSVIGKYCIVQNCEIYDVGYGVSVKGTNAEVIENRIHDLHIIKNTIGGDDDYGAVGINIEADSATIHHNEIFNCIDESYDYGVDGGVFEIYGDVMGTSIFQNYAYNSDGVFELGGGKITNTRIHHNIFVNNGELGGVHFSGKFTVDLNQFKFHHNTVVDTSGSDYEALWFNGTGNESEIELANNIFYYDGFTYFSKSDAIVHFNNVYYSSSNIAIGFELHSSEVQQNPLLNMDDFSLRENSPCIGLGTDLNYLSDYFGIVYSDQPDVGAIEYQLITSYSQNKNSETFYPNPTKSRIYLHHEMDYEIVTSSGDFVNSGYGNNVNLQEFEPGLYFLITQEGRFKIVKH